MKALYLKYRPQKIEELDLGSVREAFEKFISSGKVPHALLFAGPKGSGKTSAARILAKVLNCEKTVKKLAEPCNKCSACRQITEGSSLDVIEIDAASHRGIDEARAIREAVRLSPAGGRYKIYIVDEAHMLTTEAANALLKTLEEPPPHVVFILATTAPEKILETIRSRCTTIVFRRAKQDEVKKSLEKVVKGEKLKIEEGVLDVVAQFCEGSFRDAIKLLEQLMLSGVKITKSDAQEQVLQTTILAPDNLIELLVKRDTKGALEEIAKVVEEGGNLRLYSQGVLEILRRLLLYKTGVIEEDGEIDKGQELKIEDIKRLIKLFSEASTELKNTPIPQLPLELAVIEWCEEEVEQAQSARATKEESEGVDERQFRVSEAGPSGLKSTHQTARKPRGPVPAERGAELRDQRIGSEESSKGEITEEIWAQILQEVKPRNHSVEALLRATKPAAFDGRILTLEVFYRFHKERLEQETYRKIVEEVGSQILGRNIRVVCLLSERPRGEKSAQKEEISNIEETVDEDIVKAAQEIFGGRLVD